MTSKIYIENLKCGGCVSTISRTIAQITGIKRVTIDKEFDLVEIDSVTDFDLSVVKQALLKLGYPEKNSVQGLQKLALGAKSYVSCAIGSLNNRAKDNK